MSKIYGVYSGGKLNIIRLFEDKSLDLKKRGYSKSLKKGSLSETCTPVSMKNRGLGHALKIHCFFPYL